MIQIVSIGSQITEAFAGLERIREIRDELAEDAGDREREPLPPLEGTSRVPGRLLRLRGERAGPPRRLVRRLAGHRRRRSSARRDPARARSSASSRPSTGRPRGRSSWTGGTSRRCVSSDYRGQLGVVFQDNFLFDGTVYENIAYSRPEAPREAVLQGRARSRAATSSWSKLPEGYDTIVGERGVKLSGGQRQRVAIARAILADPRILILDEATSSLDSESEALIQEGLAELMKGRTTFVIAHRLSTIRRADRSSSSRTAGSSSAAVTRSCSPAAAATPISTRASTALESNLFLNPGEAMRVEEDEKVEAARGRRFGSGGELAAGRRELSREQASSKQ